MLKPIKGKSKSPRRIMLMGTNHVGKSSLAAQAPGVFFIDTDSGLNDLDCERTPTLLTIESVFEWLLWVAEQSYQWIAIDTVDMVEKLIQKKVVEEKMAKSFGDPCFDYGRGRKLCQPYWDRFESALRWLQTEKQMGVILLTHVDAVDVKPPDRESYQRYEPQLDKEVRETLCDWCSEVLFLSFRNMVRSVDDGFNRERKIAIDGSLDRYIRTTPTTGIRAKNRLQLPDEIPFNDPAKTWAGIQKYIDASGGNIAGVVVDGSSKAE